MWIFLMTAYQNNQKKRSSVFFKSVFLSRIIMMIEGSTVGFWSVQKGWVGFWKDISDLKIHVFSFCFEHSTNNHDRYWQQKILWDFKGNSSTFERPNSTKIMEKIFQQNRRIQSFISKWISLLTQESRMNDNFFLFKNRVCCSFVFHLKLKSKAKKTLLYVKICKMLLSK